MKSLLALMASVLMLGSSMSHSASFICDQASTKVEKLICSDKELGLLDEDLASIYKTLGPSLSAQEKGELKSQQRLWLKERNSQCVNTQSCQKVYSLRITELVSTHAKPRKLTTYELYEKFNMRTIFSSYGQRLKYYCESYPRNYFLKAYHVSEDRLELESGDDVWVFTIEGPNKIYISNQITSGTYNAGARYVIYYDQENNDWRSRETYINIPKDCKKYDQ